MEKLQGHGEQGPEILLESRKVGSPNSEAAADETGVRDDAQNIINNHGTRTGAPASNPNGPASSGPSGGFCTCRYLIQSYITFVTFRMSPS